MTTFLYIITNTITTTTTITKEHIQIQKNNSRFVSPAVTHYDSFVGHSFLAIFEHISIKYSSLK